MVVFVSSTVVVFGVGIVFGTYHGTVVGLILWDVDLGGIGPRVGGGGGVLELANSCNTGKIASSI